MQKSMKRLLSVLAVLALVLTMAPAGILAVETKAADDTVYGSTNWTAATADNATVTKTWVEEQQAKQANAKKLIDETLQGADEAARLEELKTGEHECPFCSAKTTDWRALSASETNYGSTGGRHYYVYNDVTNSLEIAFNLSSKYDNVKICILMDNDAKINLKGYFDMASKTAGYINIGGKGTITSDMSAVNETLGMFNLSGDGVALNLYGGRFINNSTVGYNRPLIFSSHANAKVNIWTDDVIIGPETAGKTVKINVRMGDGTLNMYGGTIQNGYAIKDWYQGWNVFLYRGTFNMYGGMIKNGSGDTNPRGANVDVYGANTAFNMYGGTLECGHSAYEGGSVYVGNDATAKIVGGTISGTSSDENSTITFTKNATYGGNICVGPGGSATISGSALITGGKAYTGGGNIAVSGATSSVSAGSLEITGGKIVGGTGGSYGGNIYVPSATAGSGSVSISGATITEGKAGSGGNIYLAGGLMTISSTVKITDGGNAVTATNTVGYNSYGGNIYMLKAAEGTSIAGTISGGRSLNGSNIYMISGAADISATISGGFGKLGSVFVGTTSSSTTAANVTFSGGSVSGTAFSNLNNHVNAYNKDTMTGQVHINNAVGAEGVKVTVKNGFTLEKDEKIDQIYFVKSAGKNTLTVESNWTGKANFYSSGAYYAGSTILDASVNGALNGTLKNVNGHKVDIVAGDNGALKLVDFVVIDEEGSVGYANAADALAAANKNLDAHIVTGVDFTMNGEEIVIDAMGDVTVSGTGKLYGIDYENISSGYKNTNGWVTVADGIEVQPQCGNYFALKNTDAENHPNAWTFHHVAVSLKSITVNVDNAGLYYKAEYQFDEIVKDRIASYGVNVNLEGSTKEGQTSSSDMSIYDAESHTLTAKSHGVYGIFKDTNLASTNKENGQIKLCGNPYLAIDTTGNMESSDCPEFTAAESTKMSLADAMEMANEKWEQLADKDKTALNDFVNKWNAEGAWTAELLEKLTNFTIA